MKCSKCCILIVMEYLQNKAGGNEGHIFSAIGQLAPYSESRQHEQYTLL